MMAGALPRFVAHRRRVALLVVLSGTTLALTCQAQEAAGSTGSEVEAPAAGQPAIAPAPDEGRVSAELIIVQGTPGEEGYAEDFGASVEQWKAAAEKGLAKVTIVGPEHAEQREKLQEAIAEKQPDSSVPLWIVLVGHGTFDRRAANFNLTGPDVSALDLGQWLEEFKRPLILVHGGAASAPYIRRLSREGRVIITATRSGTEINYTRFGSYLAKALQDPEADLDNDGQASVYECFLHAARQTNAFYETNGLLATEHALIDDNGDGRGSGLELLEQSELGVRQVDGDYARLWSLVLNEDEQKLSPDQRRRRNALERQILELRRKRGEFPDEAAFYAKVEPILVDIARIYSEDAGDEGGEPAAGDDGGRDDAPEAGTPPEQANPVDAAADGTPEPEAAGDDGTSGQGQPPVNGAAVEPPGS